MTDDPREITAWILTRLLDARPGWEHPALLTLLTGVSAEQALWRPVLGKRCIWELSLHTRGWREVVARRFEGQRDARFEDEWPALPGTTDQAAWNAEIDAVRAVHERLTRALRALDPAERHPHPKLTDRPLWCSALGVQIHDSYHLGQIALLRGLQGLDPLH